MRFCTRINLSIQRTQYTDFMPGMMYKKFRIMINILYRWQSGGVIFYCCPLFLLPGIWSPDRRAYPRHQYIKIKIGP